MYQDQPLTTLQQAVYWTEYVIRHKGAPHMRSDVLDLTWYQYLLLDVISVLALVAVCIPVAVYCMFRAWIRVGSEQLSIDCQALCHGWQEVS